MLAVFKTGGKQYSVKAGQILKVEKLEGKKGDSISFGDVLAISDNSNHTIGSPIIKDAKVQAKILDQIRDKKIIVFKKRRRQNYRHTQGHRQYLTVLHIESIAIGDKKSTAPARKIDENKDTNNSIAKNKDSLVKEKVSPKKTEVIKKTSPKKAGVVKKASSKKAEVKKKTTVKKKTASKKTEIKK